MPMGQYIRTLDCEYLIFTLMSRLPFLKLSPLQDSARLVVFVYRGSLQVRTLESLFRLTVPSPSQRLSQQDPSTQAGPPARALLTLGVTEGPPSGSPRLPDSRMCHPKWHTLLHTHLLKTKPYLLYRMQFLSRRWGIVAS